VLNSIFISLIGWIPAVVVMFALWPVRKAAAAAVIGAWLLLPPFGISLPGFPDYSKVTAASLGVLFGTMFFGIHHIIAFRPRWFDVPMLLWCFTGLFSSLANGLGPYDGLSESLSLFLNWGFPYFFGRLYFGDSGGLRTFTIGIIVGGLAYVLPCLWEIRMSPQLLEKVYGMSSWQGTRFGGFRPNVFFKTGLELGMWMTAASLAAWWCSRCGVIQKLGQYSFGKVVLPVLLITTVLCRSTGALVLLVAGMFLLSVSTRFKTKILLWALVLFGPVYVTLRVPNLWSGQNVVDLIQNVAPERAKSLADRFHYEDLLVARAIQQPAFGWGGWGRSTVYFSDDYQDENHKVPTDGIWIITLLAKGFVGLILLYFAMELPVLIFLSRFPVRLWSNPRIAPAAIAATLLGLYMVDCLGNGFINIIYVSLSGGLIGLTPQQFGIGPPESHRTKSTANQASRMLDLNSVGVGALPRAATGKQPDHVFPHLVVSPMAVVDQYLILGRSLKSQGRWADAHSAWQKAFNILTELTSRQSDIPDLQRHWCSCGNDLAWLLLNHPGLDSRGPAYALTLATQVTDKCSDDKAYWNTLGAAYFRNGNPNATIAALDRAIALADDGNPFNHVFLAMAYAQLGDREQAQHWLAQAILLKDRDYPNHPELACFCDEARAVVGTNPQATPAAI
jgi:hypothetical protein